jgi:hypothetical protein
LLRRLQRAAGAALLCAALLCAVKRSANARDVFSALGANFCGAS